MIVTKRQVLESRAGACSQKFVSGIVRVASSRASSLMLYSIGMRVQDSPRLSLQIRTDDLMWPNFFTSSSVNLSAQTGTCLLHFHSQKGHVLVFL